MNFYDWLHAIRRGLTLGLIIGIWVGNALAIKISLALILIGIEVRAYYRENN